MSFIPYYLIGLSFILILVIRSKRLAINGWRVRACVILLATLICLIPLSNFLFDTIKGESLVLVIEYLFLGLIQLVGVVFLIAAISLPTSAFEKLVTWLRKET